MYIFPANLGRFTILDYESRRKYFFYIQGVPGTVDYKFKGDSSYNEAILAYII